MSADLKKTNSKGHKEMSTSQEQKDKKIVEVRKLIGLLSGKASAYCSDASITRYLGSTSWNVNKAAQMLSRSLKWRQEFKPEEIHWEDIAEEAKSGKMYNANYCDKQGRTVIVMKPGLQNSKSMDQQVKFFTYCMENAVFNLPPQQHQIVWLIDFRCFSWSNLSFSMASEIAHILQEYYPERLGVAIMYNAPRIFQPFFMMVKPLLEPKTYNRIKFTNSKDQATMKMMEDLFDMDRLESAFGGKDGTGFDINKYEERMKEEDKKRFSFWTRAKTASSSVPHNIRLDADSRKRDFSPVPSPDQNILVNQGNRNVV